MSAPILTVVTLGVRDVAAASRFYETLGFKRKVRSTGDEIAFIDAGGVVLGLWSWDKLAEDAGQDAGQEAGQGAEPRPPAFRGSTLAWNCRTPEEVDAAYARGIAAGGKALRAPGKTHYGGYRGYFADLDGHAWEVVQAPGFEYEADGRLILPD